MEDFCSRIWMTYRSNFTPIGKRDSVVASLESAWQDGDSEQQRSRQSLPALPKQKPCRKLVHTMTNSSGAHERPTQQAPLQYRPCSSAMRLRQLLWCTVVALNHHRTACCTHKLCAAQQVTQAQALMVLRVVRPAVVACYARSLGELPPHKAEAAHNAAHRHRR